MPSTKHVWSATRLNWSIVTRAHAPRQVRRDGAGQWQHRGWSAATGYKLHRQQLGLLAKVGHFTRGGATPNASRPVHSTQRVPADMYRAVRE